MGVDTFTQNPYNKCKQVSEQANLRTPPTYCPKVEAPIEMIFYVTGFNNEWTNKSKGENYEHIR